MTEHTPGPWSVSKNIAAWVSSSGVTTTVIEQGSAGTFSIATKSPNAREDARLIAAVPALLEAAEAIDHEFDIAEAESISTSNVVGAYVTREQIAALRAAIAAAKGVE